ncbi:GspE/PulE family protein, partial [Patescibacteria group bacterium]
LKELFVSSGYINKKDFELALDKSERDDIPLGDVLVREGLILDEQFGITIANEFGYKFINISKIQINSDLLSIIPEVVARAQKTVFFEETKDNIKLATSNPDNYEFLKLLEKKNNKSLDIYYSTSLGIDEVMKYYKSDLDLQIKNLIQDLKENPENEQNIVKSLNLFLEYAHDNLASDIHIEPLSKDVSVRFRIDGVLHEVVRYPKTLHENIVFRVKIMAKLRTDEHSMAQDGRFDYKSKFDVRVSILPVTEGENVVMRLLTESVGRLPLEGLGFLPEDLEKMKRAISKPYGMILASGPTGSGKTTTLYAVLQVLNRPEVNIMTIEDPVEYNIEQVQQTQVSNKKNLTFATGLRSIVRQDPDIIMVGEIRDDETAGIAINSAMTGHLMLSTLHANNASTAFPRLIDMGVESYLVSSSVNVVIAQRLVRRICGQCRKSYLLSNEEIDILKSEKHISMYITSIGGNKDFSKINFYKGGGCKACGGTGYHGRIAIFEVMEINEELRTLITKKEISNIIEEKAKEMGMTSMLHDGITKVFQGITTIEEVIRVTKS